MPRTRTHRRRRTNNYGSRRDANRMKSARGALGLSQEAMGNLLGLTQGAVSHIETGDRPISMLMDRRIDELLTERAALDIIEDYEESGGTDPLECREAPPTHEGFMRHLMACELCLARVTLGRPTS